MANWKEIVQESFITGKKLSEEVRETEDNSKDIVVAIEALRQVVDNVTALRNALVLVHNRYEQAKIELNTEALKKLNSEAKVRMEMVNSSFEQTLNSLSVKKEWETEKELTERLASQFLLPVIK